MLYQTLSLSSERLAVPNIPIIFTISFLFQGIISLSDVINHMVVKPGANLKPLRVPRRHYSQYPFECNDKVSGLSSLHQFSSLECIRALFVVSFILIGFHRFYHSFIFPIKLGSPLIFLRTTSYVWPKSRSTSYRSRTGNLGRAQRWTSGWNVILVHIIIEETVTYDRRMHYSTPFT